MAKLFNRAKMTTSTTGTGTVTLGSASVGFQTFASAGVSDSDVVQYVIEEGANFEIGTGTYSSSGTSLTRTPTESSNSNNAITLAGNATVSVTAVHSDFNVLQHEGVTKVSVSSTGASVTGNLSVSGTIPAGQLTGTMPAIDGSALTGIQGIPSGAIMMWNGTNANIPSGFVLCDGTNGTPDLTDRFILGRSGSSNSGSSGGSNTVTLATNNLPSHTHGDGNYVTSNTGAHSHSLSGNTSNTGGHSHNTNNTGNHGHGMYNYYNGNTRFGYKGALTSNNQTNNSPANGMMTNAGGHSHNTNNTGNHSHSLSGNTSNTGNHSHNISGNSGATGGGSALTITPIHFTLAFIMKT